MDGTPNYGGGGAYSQVTDGAAVAKMGQDTRGQIFFNALTVVARWRPTGVTVRRLCSSEFGSAVCPSGNSGSASLRTGSEA